MQWYSHVSHSSGLAKTILQGTVKGGRRHSRQRKRWEDNIRERTRPVVRQVPEGSGERGKMEKTGCKIICGAQTTLAVKVFILRNFCVWYFVVVVLCQFVSGLILWFLNNLWFDDLRAELIGDRLNIVFGRDVVVCGWLGSKYQLTN